MCVVSMIGDHYTQKWDPNNTGTITWINNNDVSRQEFEQLKNDVREMKELLKKAKAYDEQTNQPDCEQEKKLETLRKIAEVVGINLDDVIGVKK